MIRYAVFIAAAIVCGSIALGLRAAENPIRAALLGTPVTSELGGTTSRVIATDKAYTYMAANAPAERQRAFFFGNRLFNTNWVEYPASVKSFDGLGPTFNRSSCSGCHVRDGRGRPPEVDGAPMESMLIRLSAPGGGPDPAYGDQLNDRAVAGVQAEGRAIIAHDEVGGRYGDGTPYTLSRPRYGFADLAYGPLAGVLVSPRVAPAVIGLGLLEAVPLATLGALADSADADGDGVSGRINWLGDKAGRFGWKANVATLREQAAGAAHGDIGLTSSLFTGQNCPPAQSACATATAQAEPELSDDFLDRLVIYVRTLAVPVARGLERPEVRHGMELFRGFGCAACHLPTLTTGGDAALPELRDQTLHPFTDLLLHDMGDGLADGRPDGSASGREWRTTPLWGLGLIGRVDGHDRLLHDGRARGPAEAILWHDGEASSAREAFRNASAADRAALIAFLNAL